jgi:Zn-dependent protease
MTWSLRLFRIAGTDVKVHVTFLLLLGFFWLQGGTAAALMLLGIFACVLLHEFGHIAMARRFGGRTPDVILLPLGGVARLERMPDEPRQELLIALAGPLVTLVIAVALYAWLAFTGTTPPLVPGLYGLPGGFLDELYRINVLLLLFNLIPAFPMDGGRVLRAMLASRLGLARATRIAASIGQMLAFGNGLRENQHSVQMNPVVEKLTLDEMIVTGTAAPTSRGAPRPPWAWSTRRASPPRRRCPSRDSASRGSTTRPSSPSVTPSRLMPVSIFTCAPTGSPQEKRTSSAKSSSSPAIIVSGVRSSCAASAAKRWACFNSTSCRSMRWVKAARMSCTSSTSEGGPSCARDTPRAGNFAPLAMMPNANTSHAGRAVSR